MAKNLDNYLNFSLWPQTMHLTKYLGERSFCSISCHFNIYWGLHTSDWLLYMAAETVCKYDRTYLHQHYINHNQTLFTLTFWSPSETFIRRSCSVLLPVLAKVVMRHGKKSVVPVAQCIAAIVPVHRTPSILSDVQELQEELNNFFWRRSLMEMEMSR